MKNKNIQLNASDNVIEEFYDALVSGDTSRLTSVHIPKSDVFYLRAALETATDIK